MEQEPTPFSLRLFGPLELTVGGEPASRPRNRKALWLLGLLSLRAGLVVERDWVARTLFPDLDGTAALNNLRPVLSELRTILGRETSRLRSPDRHSLRLELTGADVDVIEFDHCVVRGTVDDWERAVGLYKGALFEGCYEEWARQERARREADYLNALRGLMRHADSSGDDRRAVEWGRQVLIAAPLSQPDLRRFMEVLCRAGDRSAALDAYRKLDDRLRSEGLGLPDERTTELYMRLRTEGGRWGSNGDGPARTPLPPVPARGRVPIALTPLVGRDDEREDVANALRVSRLVTITGVGGIGKTRLAMSVAESLSRESSDPVWYVALDSLTEGEHVLGAIASAVGISEKAGRDLRSMVVEALCRRRGTLALDNCERLLRACAITVEELLRNCRNLRVLATSREPLGVPGERIIRLAGLIVPDAGSLPEGRAALVRAMLGYEGVQLFVARAQESSQAFDLRPDNARAVARLCDQAAGIPLVIELLAAQIGTMSAERIAQWRAFPMTRLSGARHAGAERQQTLRTALDWSYDLLDRPAQTLFRSLAAFEGGWTPDAAMAVSNQTQVVSTLDALVRASLVERQDDGARFTFLEPVRQYAAERLDEQGEMQVVRNRHQEWFASVAERAVPRLKGEGQAEALQDLERDFGNLTAAISWRSDEAPSRACAVRILRSLREFWECTGRANYAYVSLKGALEEEAGTVPAALRAPALLVAGWMAFAHEGPHAARRLLSESLATYQSLGDLAGEGRAIEHLALSAMVDRDFTRAEALFTEALRCLESADDASGVAVTLNNLGLLRLHVRDPIAAVDVFQRSLEASAAIGAESIATAALENLGTALIQLGRLSEAKAHIEEALARNIKLGSEPRTAGARHTLTIVLRRLEELPRAREENRATLATGHRLDEIELVEKGLREAAMLASRVDPGRAARLFGAEHALREETGRLVVGAEWDEYERMRANLRALLSDELYEREFELGHGWDRNRSVAEALGL